MEPSGERVAKHTLFGSGCPTSGSSLMKAMAGSHSSMRKWRCSRGVLDFINFLGADLVLREDVEDQARAWLLAEFATTLAPDLGGGRHHLPLVHAL